MDYTIILLLLIGVLYLAVKIDKVEGRMKSMQNTVNRLVEHFDLPESPVNNELRILIKKDEEIKAIKRAREEFGFSLLEGKEYVDRLKLSLNEEVN